MPPYSVPTTAHPRSPRRVIHPIPATPSLMRWRCWRYHGSNRAAPGLHKRDNIITLLAQHGAANSRTSAPGHLWNCPSILHPRRGAETPGSPAEGTFPWQGMWALQGWLWQCQTSPGQPISSRYVCPGQGLWCRGWGCRTAEATVLLQLSHLSKAWVKSICIRSLLIQPGIIFYEQHRWEKHYANGRSILFF